MTIIIIIAMPDFVNFFQLFFTAKYFIDVTPQVIVDYSLYFNLLNKFAFLFNIIVSKRSNFLQQDLHDFSSHFGSHFVENNKSISRPTFLLQMVFSLLVL
jgi:hypothetical protein